MDETNLIYSDVIQKEYFLFDKETNLFAGNIMSETAPENATTVPAVGFFNIPKWDPETETWQDPVNKTNKELIASLTTNVAQFQIAQMQALSDLTQKLSDLERKGVS